MDTAHIGLKGNELAAKEATERRKVERRNGKSIEINTNHTSPSPNLPFLRTMVKVSFAERLYAEWEDDCLPDCAHTFKKVLHLHDPRLSGSAC